MIVLANGKQKWVSDIIKDDYKRWKNEFVILDCGTGCGKSYFCLHVLGNYVKKQKKKILYLCNRKELKKQILGDVKKLHLNGTIYVTTYQALQQDIQNGKSIQFYHYIVADECHYFTTDALFNDYTDISYNYIMNCKQSVVLWISATAKTFFQYMITKKKVKQKNYYRMDKDYSYVNKVYYYQSDELTSIINDILENEPESKIVVFCNAGSRIVEMNKYYREEAQYYCSKSTKDTKLKELCGWTNDSDVNECIKRYPNGRISFDKRILFTTSVLDNGVDLKDEHIKHIFTEVFDIDTMIQTLGRKRSLHKNDTCTFYIREYQKKGIQWFLNQISYQLEPVKLYMEDYKVFLEQFGSGKKRQQIQKNDILYPLFKKNKGNAKIKINECKYRKHIQDNETLTMMKDIGHIGFLELVLSKELIEKAETIVINVEQIDIFLEFLKSIEGKPLYSDDRQYIKEEFEEIGVKLRYVGINTFNGALKDIYGDIYKPRFYNKDENGKSYIDGRRKLQDGTVNPNNNKRYWRLECR